MFYRGINYDVGTAFRAGELSRVDFDERAVEKEITIIREELKCDSIRISGFDIDRLETAARLALDHGLQVWFSPAHIDATQADAFEYLGRCAQAAERLRKKNENIIFVLGCEYSLFLKGFIRGTTIYDRLANMFSPVGILMNILGLRNGVYRKLNRFLRETVTNVRELFAGKLTYASGTWEKIDWSLFDIVSIDHYRASYNVATYAEELAAYYRFDKPVAVTEFGCCAYKGADEKGGTGWAITEKHDGAMTIKDGYIRDETVQANYLIELLDIFKKENLYAAFVFTFINPAYKHDDDPKRDLDMASYGIVKPVAGGADSYEGLPWVPKKAFYELSQYYAKLT